MSAELIPIWRVTAPTRTVTVPEWMSFHILREAERCPLASVLRRSQYTQLWDRNGYPNKPTVPAAIGIIVHSSAQRLMGELMEDGVSSSRDEKAIETLRRLGGFSAVIKEEMSAFIQSEQINPRFQSFALAFQRSLTNKLPRMRELLQELLSEQHWTARSSGPRENTSANARSAGAKRFRLRLGTSFEVELREPVLKWKGRVDVITVSNNACSILDLKTGEPSDIHIEQLKVYSVLWDGDQDLNPDRLPLSELKIFYGSSAVSLDIPTIESLAHWRSALIKRTGNVLETLGLSPVPARPSPENCGGCQVKLLCNEYWKLQRQPLDDQFQDMELTLISKRGDVGWVGQDTRHGSSSRELLLTRPNGGLAYWDELASGMRIRITDAHFTVREGETPLVVATTFSEAVLI
jgi:hypothetical protein